MKLIKRVTALSLCLLMLISGLIQALALTEDTIPTETTAACTECGQADGHTEECSQYEASVEEQKLDTTTQIVIPTCPGNPTCWGTYNGVPINEHQDSVCTRKEFLKTYVIDNTAESIAADWKNFTAAEQTDILVMVQAYHQAIYEELKALVDSSTDDGGEDVVLQPETACEYPLEVSGKLPAGTKLTAETVTQIDYSQFDLAGEGDVKAVLDISLWDSSDNEYQPSADEQTVLVTIDAEEMGLSDGTLVRVHHLYDDGSITVIEPVVVVGGKLMFPTDSFSIYLVEALGSTNSTQEITAGSTQSMIVGEEKVFYIAENDALWVVENTALAISYTTMPSPSSSMYLPWIQVRAEKAGTATIMVEEGKGTNNRSITIIVSEQGGFHIENEVVETGRLVPKWDVTPEGVTYQWTRSDGVAVRTEAIGADGSVNVAIDRGGVIYGKDPITYTVTAMAASVQIGTATYKITYGNEILNPSFEEPAGPGSDFWYKANGTPGLYWQTTSPGSGTGRIGQDIEFGYGNNNPYGIGSAADGNQFVELNAEGFGTLYQDILTTAGAELEWSFSHTSRANAEDRMYVVVASTQDAQNIIDLEDIKGLLKAAEIENATPDLGLIPSGNSGKEGYSFKYNNGTYQIWTDTSTKSAQTVDEWNKVSGTYEVPNDQYLTRLFFISDPYLGSNSYGNIIDGVTAGDYMSYRVEYYVDNKLQGERSEFGDKAPVYHAVALENLSQYTDTYEGAQKILINGKIYPGTLKDLQDLGLYITSYGEKPETMNYEEDVVLQIYFQSNSIIVTKEIDIEGWKMLTAAQKAALIGDGIDVTFGLFEAETDRLLSETTLTVQGENSMGELIVQGAFEFEDIIDYIGHELVVKETNVPKLQGYELSAATEDQKFTLSENESKVLYFTNEYVVKISDLNNLVTSKKAEFTKESGTGTITLESYLKGNMTSTPTDVVLLVDRSAFSDSEEFENALSAFGEEMKNAKDCRVAVAAFAGSESSYTGSGIFAGESFNSNLSGFDYQSAFVNLSTTDGQNFMQSVISALKNADNTIADGTPTALGLQYANLLFTNAGKKDANANKVVIMFTDDTPSPAYCLVTKKTCDCTVGNRDENCIYCEEVENILYSTYADQAQVLKTVHHATVYSIAPSNSNGVDTILNNIATDEDHVYKPAASELSSVYKDIAGTIVNTSQSFTDETKLVDTLAPSFRLPANVSGSDIKVYTAPYIGDVDGAPTFGEKTSFARAKVDIEDNTVTVSGFDYQQNAVVSDPIGGSKLIVEIPFVPIDGFLGGDRIPTNEPTSGIYNDNTVIELFDEPKVDVPLRQVLPDVQDGVIYVSQKADLSELVDVSDYYIDEGTDLWSVNGVVNKYAKIKYTITDPDTKQYMTFTIPDGTSDLSSIQWEVLGGLDLNQALETDKTYKITTSVMSALQGISNEANPQESTVKVFKPEITYKDSVIDVGGTAVYAKENFDAVLWKNNGNEPTVEEQTALGLAPGLTYTYSPTAGAVRQDTPVQVTAVNIDDEEILKHVTFIRRKCDHHSCDHTVKSEVNTEYSTWVNFVVHVDVVDLTIHKEGWNTLDENQTFMFRVEKDGFSLDVTITGNGSVTIKDLPAGVYTVTELNNWSWRYKNLEGITVDTDEADKGKIAVTFTNTRQIGNWLSGDSYCKNWWGGSNGSVVRRDEDNAIMDN